MDNVEVIDGVGRHLARKLKQAGFDSIEAIAKADPSTLEGILGPRRSQDIQKKALALLDPSPKLVCPACGSSDITERVPTIWGKRFRCRSCGKSFLESEIVQ
jgi:ribosomal protein L37AE/L43A